eukprot:1795407-Pleurochrysis_carterae.AAC.1
MKREQARTHARKGAYAQKRGCVHGARTVPHVQTHARSVTLASASSSKSCMIDASKRFFEHIMHD